MLASKSVMMQSLKRAADKKNHKDAVVIKRLREEFLLSLLIISCKGFSEYVETDSRLLQSPPSAS
jgi:hypothetical protein